MSQSSALPVRVLGILLVLFTDLVNFLDVSSSSSLVSATMDREWTKKQAKKYKTSIGMDGDGDRHGKMPFNKNPYEPESGGVSKQDGEDYNELETEEKEKDEEEEAAGGGASSLEQLPGAGDAVGSVGDSDDEGSEAPNAGGSKGVDTSPATGVGTVGAEDANQLGPDSEKSGSTQADDGGQQDGSTAQGDESGEDDSPNTDEDKGGTSTGSESGSTGDVSFGEEESDGSDSSSTADTSLGRDKDDMAEGGISTEDGSGSTSDEEDSVNDSGSTADTFTSINTEADETDEPASPGDEINEASPSGGEGGSATLPDSDSDSYSDTTSEEAKKGVEDSGQESEGNESEEDPPTGTDGTKTNEDGKDISAKDGMDGVHSESDSQGDVDDISSTGTSDIATGSGGKDTPENNGLKGGSGETEGVQQSGQGMTAGTTLEETTPSGIDGDGTNTDRSNAKDIPKDITDQDGHELSDDIEASLGTEIDAVDADPPDGSSTPTDLVDEDADGLSASIEKSLNINDTNNEMTDDSTAADNDLGSGSEQDTAADGDKSTSDGGAKDDEDGASSTDPLDDSSAQGDSPANEGMVDESTASDKGLGLESKEDAAADGSMSEKALEKVSGGTEAEQAKAINPVDGSCTTADTSGSFGSCTSGKVVEYSYEVLVDPAIESVVENVLPSLEKGISDLLLPELFEPCASGRRYLHVRRLKLANRRLVVSGLSASPPDTIQIGETCSTDIAAYSCSVVDGRLTICSTSADGDGSRDSASALDAIRSGMNDETPNLIDSHPAIVNETFVDRSPTGTDPASATSVVSRGEGDDDNRRATLGFVVPIIVVGSGMFVGLMVLGGRKKKDEDELGGEVPSNGGGGADDGADSTN